MKNSAVRFVCWLILIAVWCIALLWARNSSQDDCMVAYTAEVMMAASCLLIYLWWWRKSRRASAVYAAVTGMFLGIVVSGGVQYYARYVYLYDYPAYMQVMGADWWAWRQFPKYLAMAYMASVIVARLITGRGDDE